MMRFPPGMSRRIVAMAAISLLLPAASLADDAATRVDRYLAQLSSLRADFSQQVIDADGTLREEAEGVVAIQKPGRFRWDYRQPAAQVLVSDGRTIWLHDVDLEQVTVRQADQALSATPASLLSGRGKASETFDIADGGRADGLEWAVLTPRLQDTDFRQVRLGFGDGLIQRMELVDRLGQTTRIQFHSIDSNPRLPADLFDFKPPPGADVIGSAASP